jgi:hypothetical protein
MGTNDSNVSPATTATTFQTTMLIPLEVDTSTSPLSTHIPTHQSKGELRSMQIVERVQRRGGQSPSFKHPRAPFQTQRQSFLVDPPDAPLHPSNQPYPPNKTPSPAPHPSNPPPTLHCTLSDPTQTRRSGMKPNRGCWGEGTRIMQVEAQEVRLMGDKRG